MTDHPNFEFLKRVAREITPLLPKVVFVGGATATVFMTDSRHIKLARETLDVDLTLDVTKREFYRVEKTLRDLGFNHDGKTTFRFLKDDIILDIMPTDETIIGFSNRWYKEAISNAELLDLGDCKISMITFPYFLATKLEAFLGRGRQDYFGSKDIEDIVTVLGGRKGFLRDLLKLQDEIHDYLVEKFSKHLQHQDFRSALTGHLPQGESNETDADRILADLDEFCMGQD